MKNLIRTTLVGGVLFLIPLVFVVLLIGKSFKILKVVTQPLATWIPSDYFGGPAPVVVLTSIIMFVLCFVVGLLAYSPPARRMHAKLDAILLQIIPGYAWAKGMTGSLSDDDAEEVLKPVFVRLDDMSQIGFEVDRTEAGLVAVYLPAAPNAREGSVGYFEQDRIEPITAGLKSVVQCYKKLGRGSATMLSGVG